MLCLPSAKSEVSNYRAGLLARLVCFGRNGGKTTATTNTTPTALVRRTVIPPSSLSCVSRSLVPPALLSCAPLLAKGGEAPRTPAIPSSVRAGTGAICAHRHWRQRQQVELAMACGGSASLWHQCRGMAISSGGPINFKRVHGTPQKHGTKEVKEKPRLICLARRVRKLFNNKNGNNDNVAIANKNGDSADLIDIASRKSSASFPSDLSRSVKSMTMTEKLRIEEEQEVVVVEEEEKHIPMNEEEEEEGTITATVVTGDYKEDEASVVTPPPSPPPFQHTVEYSKSRHRRDRDTLVYNIFTHRVVKCSAASVRALGVLGIDVPHDSQELDVVDPSVLLSLQNKLLQKEVSWPPSWRGVLFRQVYNALIYISKEKVVEEVRKLLSLHYQRAKTRHGVGVVSNDDNNTNNLGETEGALLSNEANMSSDSSGDLSLQDRLLTYSDLNEEQQSVVDFVLDGHNTYIGGGAGTGKSLLLRVIKQELVNKGLHVAMTATTGIAATRIDGVTLHHCFGVNIHGECTRRKELRAFDVIIVDEVSMLSRDLFESFEYQLRRANGVDLPFGGIQIILSGDFLQLGAIASLPLVHSAIFRRYFAMLKLQKSVRQLGNNHFIRQLQELRRGIVPHDLQDTVTFLSPTESAKAMRSDTSSVKLLPTNKEVDIINQAELEKLPGDVVEFPAQLQSPSLSGRWTASYILAIQDEYLNSLDVNVLYKALEQYLLEFVTKVPRSSSLTFSLLGQRYIVLYKLFLDAFVFRVRIPHELNENDEMELASHLRNLESWLPTQGLGVYLKEIIESSDGLHTDVHEYTLTQYANSSPMMSPLRLKKGAKVMLRTNLSPGLVNGGLGVIVGFKELKVEHLPRYLTKSGRLEAVENYIEFLQYEHSYPVALAPEVDFGGGRIIVVPPTTFCVGGLSNTHHYQMGIVAFPLSLAYAFTVHKVQGLTLVGRVHLELSRMWPCEHLLYVAMSRVRNPEQLTVSCFHRDLVRCATECLLFDESLPSVKDVRVLPHFFQATWRRVPSRCKAALRLKEKLKESKKEKNVKKAGSPLRRRVGIVRGFR